MSPACTGITQAISTDCANPPTVGVKALIYLANKDDILTVTLDSNPNIINDITMKAGGKAFFEYEGKNDSVDPLTQLARSTYDDRWSHQVRFKVFTKSQNARDELQLMAKVKTVALVFKEDGTYEVFGIGAGLQMTECVEDPKNVDTGGAFDVLLQTDPDKVQEAKLPNSFFDTDVATTDANVAALIVPTA